MKKQASIALCLSFLSLAGCSHVVAAFIVNFQESPATVQFWSTTTPGRQCFGELQLLPLVDGIFSPDSVPSSASQIDLKTEGDHRTIALPARTALLLDRELNRWDLHCVAQISKLKIITAQGTIEYTDGEVTRAFERTRAHGDSFILSIRPDARKQSSTSRKDRLASHTWRIDG